MPKKVLSNKQRKLRNTKNYFFNLLWQLRRGPTGRSDLLGLRCAIQDFIYAIHLFYFSYTENLCGTSNKCTNDFIYIASPVVNLQTPMTRCSNCKSTNDFLYSTAKSTNYLPYSTSNSRTALHRWLWTALDLTCPVWLVCCRRPPLGDHSGHCIWNQWLIIL